ncbi:MAG: peptide deformylase [Kiritimatiellae bacterium]|nr:peptide deformylase [Kiritimatiellia bacterium]MDW8458170.1 peptide deformylase [Verrucomicrobiota bacterium]
MKLELRYYGDPILRKQAEPVRAFGMELRKLIDDMLETMRAAQGIGLAAPQVGWSQAVAVIEMPIDYDLDENGQRLNPDAEMPLVLVNPAIRNSSKKMDLYEEGCLSFPGIRAEIERPYEIEIAFQLPDGTSKIQTFRDFLARVIQHEVDHLNGVLFIDRMSSAKRFALAGKLKRLKRETEERLGVSPA